MEDINLRKVRLIEFILQEHDHDAIRQFEELTVRIAYDEDSKSKIIGYRPNSIPVIKSEFLDAIVQSLREVNDGSFYTVDQLEKESESW